MMNGNPQNSFFSLALLCLLVGSGCATPSTRLELDSRIQANSGVGLSHVFYKGTRGEYHHLRHQHGRGVDLYRIHRDELTILPEQPLSRNPDDWILLAERWWPDREKVSVFELRSTPAAGVLPAEGGQVILRPAPAEEDGP